MKDKDSETASSNTREQETASERILYCHCNYAQIIAPEVKQSVLKKLCASGRAFDAVADLCEMAARKDPALLRLTQGGGVKIAACFPRAVKWLFSGANVPLDRDHTEVVNMRENQADKVLERLLAADLQPNLPADNKPPPASEQAGNTANRTS